jgi:hypothetical protein
MNRPRLSRPTIVLALTLTMAGTSALAAPRAHHERVAITLVAAQLPSQAPTPPLSPPSPRTGPSPASSSTTAAPSAPPPPPPTASARPTPTVAPRPPRTATPTPAARPAPQGDPREYARSQLGDTQFSCLDAIWSRESDWDPTALNPSSGAYGIPQALPASKMASAGEDWHSNAVTQIRWGISYIHSRYGTPCSAWSFWQSHHWY